MTVGNAQNNAVKKIKIKCRKARLGVKLLALVYDILPQTTAVSDYAIGLEKTVH